MPEVREVNVQQMDQRCSVCNQGFMRPNGIVNMTTPPTFEHTCNSCGKKESYPIRYPYNIS